MALSDLITSIRQFSEHSRFTAAENNVANKASPQYIMFVSGISEDLVTNTECNFILVSCKQLPSNDSFPQLD